MKHRFSLSLEMEMERLKGGRDRQFFLVPEERLEGRAAKIMVPASWATLIKRSWISCKLRSDMLAMYLGVCDDKVDCWRISQLIFR